MLHVILPSCDPGRFIRLHKLLSRLLCSLSATRPSPLPFHFAYGFENTRVEHTAETCVDLASDVPIIDGTRHC
ncbi:hypothetical protein BD293_4494 [Roseinatronobacter monicus]|uniref:Uncharacterized protein n=1 Tax=Roseinatronobacter monicus TaxID=393481 RepID=A0A543K348_9RHOB|nr:hypothetical protein BD293_4494 [Roseinatronobacter monicus]